MQNQQNQSRSLVAPGSASQFLQPVVSGEPGGVFTGPLYYFFWQFDYLSTITSMINLFYENRSGTRQHSSYQLSTTLLPPGNTLTQH